MSLQIPDQQRVCPGRDGESAAGNATVIQPAKETADARDSRRSDLLKRVTELEAEQRQLLERCINLEEQNSALTTIYVACQRLHSELSWGEVLATTREIVANLVGCEEYVLFTLAGDGWLRRLDSAGVAPELYQRVLPGHGLIGRSIETGETYIVGEGDSSAATSIDRNLTACIPLKRNATVTGAIALFRLLPQKSGLQPLDRELFQLLETHLATALYHSELAQAACLSNGDGA